ncbi:hypothetical protein [Bordetella genomosp. 7]|uniref:Uncharacterized protein n=1 Tax=Bordetella genomosp. 7 TaxID=1416805 RepID=A0A261QYR3_9BORD|nr:hypothetical protein [Bordetella genomosp. 7]OZI17915.1 hypothetical protein CAL19_12595 [Bordetella genomosp. 7]
MPIWLVKYWKPLAVVALVIGAALAWEWRWSSGYLAGEAAAKTEAQALTAAIERGIQAEKDRADAIHRGAVLAREAAQRDLAAARTRLDRLLLANGRDPSAARAGSRPDDSGPDWIGGFAACYAEYGELAIDAARWADQVNGLQGYIRAVQQANP